MAKMKVPVRASFKQLAHSPHHKFPFHFVGMIEDQQRYVITGLTEEQAKILFVQLGKALENGDNKQSEQSET